MHQKKFIYDLLAVFNSYDCSSGSCPLELNVKVKAKEGDSLPNPENYRSLIDKLSLLTHTILDLSFLMQYLNQFMQQPCFPHIKATLLLLRYLRGTFDLAYSSPIIMISLCRLIVIVIEDLALITEDLFLVYIFFLVAVSLGGNPRNKQWSLCV